MKKLLTNLVIYFLTVNSVIFAEQKVYLDEMDVLLFSTGWGDVNVNKAVSGNPLSIAGVKYKRGVGLHAVSVGRIDLKGSAESFSALVGADDGNGGSVKFVVMADGEALFKSPFMRKGDKALKIDVDLKGKKTLELIVTDGGNGIGQDHADWVDAYITYSNLIPDVISPPASPPAEVPVAFIPAIPLEDLKKARAELIPYPKHADWLDEDFVAKKMTICVLEKDNAIAANAVASLTEVFRAEGFNFYRIKQIKSVKDAPTRSILLTVGSVEGTDSKEAYKLEVEKKTITITAPESAGLFYGVQTLRQLWTVDEKITVPCCNIVDYPAFRVRGFMHDCGRNFQTIDSLKEQMTIFAFYKLNVFHWHLTDNPAWRIESKKYPQLNDPKNHRPGRDPGKFYTYEQINELIDYCDKLHIQVIPEIDMPGHSQYFPVAMGFKMHTQEGMAVLKDCLNEFFEHVSLEKAPIIHIGSDEVHIPNPKEFMETMSGVVTDAGREVVVWKPGLKGTDDTIYQFWSGGIVPDPTIRYLDSTGGYLNGINYINSVSRFYFQQPCLVECGDDNAMGGILCLWPDIRVDDKRNILRHSPMYPSLLSFSEKFWVGRKEHNSNFTLKLPVKDKVALEHFQEFEGRVVSHRDRYFKNKPFYFVRHSHIEWTLMGPFDNGGNLEMVFGPEKSIQAEYEVDGRVYKSIRARGGEVNLAAYAYSKLLPNNPTVYAVTWIKSEIDQTVPFWIGFECPKRAQRRYKGLPQQGEWDANGGKIWVNDKPLSGPQWDNPGKYDNHQRATWGLPQNEIPLTDEEFYWTRPTTKIQLKKGWNKVLIKCPRSYRQQNWIFAFVPVDMSSGSPKEVDGLEFSADKK